MAVNSHSQLAAPPISGLMQLKPTAYWRTFWDESLAFKVACIYLMFEYVRPQSIWPAMDILPFGLLSLVSGAILVLCNRERGLLTYGSKLPLLVVFFLHVVITILASQYPKSGFDQLPTLIGWMLAYVLITKAVNNERRLLVFYMLFLLFSFKMSQHGFKAWVASGFGFNREGVNGAPGWFQNSGEVGIQMCIFLPMVLHFIVAGWRHWEPWKKGAMLILPLTAIGTIVASSSRGAIIGSAAALLWMLGRSKYKFRGFVSLGIVALIVAAVLPEQFYARFDTMGEDNSSQLRLQYWAFGWEMMKEHPLFGIGYFNWIPVYTEHLFVSGVTRKPEVVHNIFIQAGSELGFPGLLLVIALIVSTFVLNFRTSRLLGSQDVDHFLRHMALGLDAGMIGFLISAQFVTVLYYPYLWIALAMTVALHNVAQYRLKASGASSSDKSRLLRRTGRLKSASSRHAAPA